MWLVGCIQIFLRQQLALQRCISGESICKRTCNHAISIHLFPILIVIGFFFTATAQNQSITSTPHDAAIALGVVPFSIDTMKTEAVVLTEDLVTGTANQQVIGRSAFANSNPNSQLSSSDLLKKVINPPQRQDFNLNGSVAYLESSRSPVVQTYGVWEAPAFYDIEKLIFDPDGSLIAQRSYYNPEELVNPTIAVKTTWLDGIWYPGKNRRNRKKAQEASTTATEEAKEPTRLKTEGCYSLAINFEAEGFDCFDAEESILSVTEWDAKGAITKTDKYHLDSTSLTNGLTTTGPWIALHVEESLVAPTYRIERHYDFSANLIEFKRFDSLQENAIATEHLRFFYNENGQRVTEAVLNPSTGLATDCRFLIYGYFNTLETIHYYSVTQDTTNEDEAQNNNRETNVADGSAAFRSTLSEQNYTCEKEIPSILTPEKSTVMTYGWLYDANNELAGRRKQEISHYDAEGALIERTIFSYLDSRPTTLAAINKYNGVGQSTASIIFEYDKQDRLVKEERYRFDNDEAGKLLELTNYIYKAKESTLLEKTVEDYEHSRSKAVESYDEAGNLVREQKFELSTMLGLNNMFRIKSDVSKSYTGRSFVNEIQLEQGRTKQHESYTYVFDYIQNTNNDILNWIQKDEGSFVNKFDSSYSEPHHTIARNICYYPDALSLSSSLVCTSPFDPE